MTENGLHTSQDKLKAWRADVARGIEKAIADEEKSKLPRPSARRAAGELATETEVTVPAEEPESS